MLTGLDHIIIGVNDLEKAAKVFSQNLGLAVSGGGIHPTGGTANRIIVIGDTYIELITVNKPEEAQQGILDRLAKDEGYLNFVLTSNDIAADVEAISRRGIHVIGPAPGQLRSAGGRERNWFRADVERPELAQHYPFIIQHDSTGEERRFKLAGWNTPPSHPLGAIKVLSTTIAVESLKEAAPRFEQIYGLSPSEPYTGDAEAWEAMLVAFRLGTGEQHFELAEPLPLADNTILQTSLLPEPGSLTNYLATYGESLCRITLAVEHMEDSRRFLDAHGITYTYQDAPHPVLWIHSFEACGAAIVLHEMVDAF
jgi:catechol 2,3-dioxygenase-like lactoylglutathione lyase family enzyme